MATKTFDEVVAGLQLSADEKKLFDSVIAKTPDLKAGWMRQDEFNRKLNENRDEFERLQSYEEKMKPWSAEVYDRLEALRAAGVLDDQDNETWTSQKTALEQQLEAAKAAGGDMTPEQLEASVKNIVKSAGVLTKEEIAALYENEAKKLVEDGFKEREQKFNSETIPFVAGFSAAMAIVANHYEKESGKPWTPELQQQVYAMMSAEKNFDPFKFEEKILEPVKAAKVAEAETQKKIDEEVKRRLAERGTPGSGHDRYIPQPEEARGALQKALEQSGDGDLRDAVRAAAVEGAKELIEAGKA